MYLDLEGEQHDHGSGSCPDLGQRQGREPSAVFSKLVSFRGKTAGIEGREIGGATQYEFSLSI